MCCAASNRCRALLEIEEKRLVGGGWLVVSLGCPVVVLGKKRKEIILKGTSFFFSTVLVVAIGVSR